MYEIVEFKDHFPAMTDEKILATEITIDDSFVVALSKEEYEDFLNSLWLLKKCADKRGFSTVEHYDPLYHGKRIRFSRKGNG